MKEETTLYRKYRPQNFSDVVGQEAIISALSGALKNKKIAHAYLFAGGRGTGKTTTARIFARALGVSEKDLYEIDAASNRGIDEIRELREAVHTLPFDSPYKVYIVDEVHMLTTPAFNALLKTLEEPPAHVIFILATTELHKVPETIISRCQTFTFKRPTLVDIRALLEKVADEEGYTAEVEALELMSILGDGSYRDAMGVLQKVIGGVSSKKISIADVESLTAAPKVARIHALLEAIADKDIPAVLANTQKVEEEGIDAGVFLKMLLQHIRFVMLLVFAPESKTALASRLSPEDLKKLSALGAKAPAIWPPILKELLTAYEDQRVAYIKVLPIELALLRVLGSKAEGK